MYKNLKEKSRNKRHLRLRKKVSGTKDIPRLNVYRSIDNIYVQLIDDIDGKTLLSVSTLSKEIKNEIKTGGNIDSSKVVGALMAKKALESGFKKVVFDKGGYKYHGRVKALADSAREKGLIF